MAFAGKEMNKWNRDDFLNFFRELQEFFQMHLLNWNNSLFLHPLATVSEAVSLTANWNASVAELVDALDSKSCTFGCAGSIPARGTNEVEKPLEISRGFFVFTAFHFVALYSHTVAHSCRFFVSFSKEWARELTVKHIPRPFKKFDFQFIP